MKAKILLTEEISPAGIAALEKEAEILRAPTPSVESALPLVGDADGIISRNTVIDSRIFSQAPRLKAVASHGVGYDHIDVKAATERGVYVVNTPGANAQSVAELALAMMLALGRKMVYADRVFRAGKDYYIRNHCSGQDIAGKTLLIFGMGAIGKTLTKICAGAFSMRVLGCDPFVSREQMAALGAEKADSFEEALPLADYVTLHSPYVDELYHIVNEKTLALMKPGAFLINCARGKLVDEAALYQALKEHAIAGAGLDVFDPEPPEAGNPLFTLDNVITTPHLGYNAVDSFNRMSLWSVEDVLSVIRGEPGKAHVVNRELL